MSDQLYETWWYNSSEGGFYYRGRWYATEADLNSAGYYKVYLKGLSLGSTRHALKYQKDLYQLPDGSFKTYAQAHAEGWTESRSLDKVFIRLSDYTILYGYYNSYSGYYVEGVWYQTESDLNTTGYLEGDEEVVIYSTTSLTIYKAIKNQNYGYFIADSSYPSWLSESDLEALGLSLFPYVDINWHLETLYSTGIGHSDRDATSYNYLNVEHLGRRVEYSQLTSLLGTPSLYKEFNVKGAYIGYYREWLHGKAIYLERYQSSGYIASIYRHSLDIPNSDNTYADHQPFALINYKDAEIVKVYSKENLPYNAFKFTKSNLSYYFVLDGEERTWTYSLSSIGFSLAKNSKVLEILADFGDTIYIPSEYNIESFYVQQVYLKLIQSIAETNWYRALFYGKDQVSTKLRFWNFCDRYETNESVLLPWVRVFQPTSFDVSSKYLLGYSYTYEGGSSIPSYRYKYDLNGTDPVYGDYFIQIGGNDRNIKQYADYGYPLRIRVGYNTTNNLYDPYFLHLPSNLWYHNQSTGNIDWLEDTTDTSTVSFYYKNDTAGQVTSTKRLHIFIKSSSSVEAYHVAIRDNVTREVLSAIAYPNHGYFFNGILYPTEQDLETNGYKLLGQATRILVHIFPSNEDTRNIAPSMPISGMTVTPNWDINSRSRLYKDYDCTTPLLYEDSYDYCVDMTNSSLYRGRNYTDSLYNYTPYTHTSDNTNNQYRLYLITLICNNDNNSPRYPYRDLSDRQLCLYQCANQGPKASEYEIPTLSVLKYQDPYHCEDLETPFIAYDAEKNTYQGVKQNGLYKIPSIDNTPRSEEEWLERNIYIKWDIIQCNGAINIRNSYGTEGTTIIGVWDTTTSIIVKENDYTIVDSNKWAHIRFSDDGGSTIKDGWVNTSASSYVYYKDSFEVESDVVILPF